MQFYAYIHVRPTGDIFYVGKGSRKRSHDFYGRNCYHKSIVAKDGKTNIAVHVLPCQSEQHAFDEEKRIIYLVRATGFNLSNLCDGGGGVAGYKPIRKTHCKHGHEFTQENTIVRERGHRACRLCANGRTLTSWRKANGKVEMPKFSKLYCNVGHQLFGENMHLTPHGRRQCKECQRERVRQHRKRQAA